MVTSCAVPMCANRQKKGNGLRFYRLPMKNKQLLKIWLDSIRCSSIAIHTATRICSAHFEGNHKKGKHDVPSIFPWQKQPNPRHTRGRINSDEEQVEEETEESYHSDDIHSPDERPDEGNLQFLADVCTQLTGFSNLHILFKTCETICNIEFQSNNLHVLAEICEKESQVEVIRTVQTDAEKRVHELQARLSWYVGRELSSTNVKKDPSKLKFFTGFTSLELYETCKDFITECQLEDNSKTALSLDDQFLMVLTRLRLGLQEELLAYIFHVNVNTISRTFLKWIPCMYRRFKLLNIWPSNAQVLNSMLRSVALKYPSLRVIIDCTEMKIFKPKGPVNQQVTFSSYKNCNTAKAVVGVSPAGAISFVSELYGGNISDTEITKQCGIVELMEPGDMIMADRGFLIEDLAKIHGIKVNVPPFTGGRGQLEPTEVIAGRRIANTRIHIERAIGRIKEFKILTKIQTHHIIPYLNEIFYICAMLTNFKAQLITK